MAKFGQFLAKMGKTGIFFKKAFGKYFSLLKALINCKVSEKSNERFPRKSVAYGSTDEHDSLSSQTTVARENKNQKNPVNQSEEK